MSKSNTSFKSGNGQQPRWGWRKRLAIVVSLSVIAIYILATPAGLLDKADWIGYAVCHRIPSHSLGLHGRPLPLCARCTGTFLGAMIAIGLFLKTRPRSGSLPPLRILLILLGFSLTWALDGLNSYVDLSHGIAGGLPIQPVYQPQNWLRLLTGTLHGLMMASVMYPIAMGTIWKFSHPTPVLRNARELGLLVLLAIGAVALGLTGAPAISFILAVVSASGVLAMLTLVNMVMLLVLLRRENLAVGWRDLILPALGGLATSFLLVGSIGILRYTLTGTLTSLPGLPL